MFALDPGSDAPTGGWDRRAGFATEGEAARARREEDRRRVRDPRCHAALAPVRERRLRAARRRRRRVGRGARRRGRSADVVLVPGSPLTHPDHAWLNAARSSSDCGACRRSAATRSSRTRSRARGAAASRPSTSALRDRVAKWRAIRAYRSQLPLLGMRRSLRDGPLACPGATSEDEAVAWRRVSSLRRR